MCDSGAGSHYEGGSELGFHEVPSLPRSALKSPPERRPADGWRTLHDHKTSALKMPYEPRGHDFRHELGRVPLAASSVESQRERQRVD